MMLSLSSYPYALSAWEDTGTISPDAAQHVPGTTKMIRCLNVLASCSLPNQANNCAPSGRKPMDAQTHIVPCISARVAVPNPMEPSVALALRTLSPSTPYKVEAWDQALRAANLFLRFMDIPTGFHNGFLVDFPTLSHTQSSPNKDSVLTHIEEFQKMIDNELTKGHYIGPFSKTQLVALIRPFQSSPISIIPKPRHPGKFRIVQNFSFPISPSLRFPNPSINSYINAADFPASWGTFSIIYLTISRLPPGSEAATRDVAEAYRTISLHPSQWAAAVVRATHHDLYIDTCTEFGATPSAGIHGHVADAAAEIFRSCGIGPLDKWVDDHIFLRINTSHISDYNASRHEWYQQIADGGGIKQSGSCLWFAGISPSDGLIEEFNENCSFPLIDQSRHSPRSEYDKLFTYALEDIDAISAELGIPWKKSKDQPFAPTTIYIGFRWDLCAMTVALAPVKVDKYLAAINEWLNRSTHVLKDAQGLYGKLLHACAALPRGRAYLTALECMLRVCHEKSFMPH